MALMRHEYGNINHDANKQTIETRRSYWHGHADKRSFSCGIVLHAQMKQGGSEGCFVFLESINVATSSALERTYAKEIR